MRSYLVYESQEREGVAKIGDVQLDAGIVTGDEVDDARRGYVARRRADRAVDLVTETEQVFSQVRAVLTGDAGYERSTRQ